MNERRVSLGSLEAISLRFSFLAYIAGIVVVFREWGDWAKVWEAVAAMTLASPIGLLLGGLILLPIALLIGRISPIESPPARLGQDLVSVVPLIGILWAIVLCMQSFD